MAISSKTRAPNQMRNDGRDVALFALSFLMTSPRRKGAGGTVGPGRGQEEWTDDPAEAARRQGESSARGRGQRPGREPRDEGGDERQGTDHGGEGSGQLTFGSDRDGGARGTSHASWPRGGLLPARAARSPRPGG